MGMVMLPPGVTWEQYNDWLQNTPEGRQYSQYINQASAGIPTGVSHAPPMPPPWQYRPIAPAPQPAPIAPGPISSPLPVDDTQETEEEQWRNSRPGRAQPIRPQSQGTPLRPPVAASPAAPGPLPGNGGQPPQQDFGHQYDPWAGATRAPGQPLNRGGPSIGPTKYIGRDGKPMYAH